MSKLRAKRSRRLLSSKSPSMEIATMEKPSQEKEIFHFSHPCHPLAQISLPYLFTCNGCKEYGAGKRHKCKICEFDLHDFCALAPPSLHNHPFHPQHQLVFFTKSGMHPRPCISVKYICFSHIFCLSITLSKVDRKYLVSEGS